MATKLFAALEDLEVEDSAVFGDTPYGEEIEEIKDYADGVVGVDNIAPQAMSDLNEAQKAFESLSYIEDLRLGILAKENISQEDFNMYNAAYMGFKKSFEIEDDKFVLEENGDFRLALEKAGYINNGFLAD